MVGAWIIYQRLLLSAIFNLLQVYGSGCSISSRTRLPTGINDTIHANKKCKLDISSGGSHLYDL